MYINISIVSYKNKGEIIMFNYDILWAFNKKEAKLLYKCINLLVKNNGRRMVSYDTVVGYTLLCMLEKHIGLSKDNPVMFYIDALRVDVGYSEYTDTFILSVYEDGKYAERCRASA